MYLSNHGRPIAHQNKPRQELIAEMTEPKKVLRDCILCGSAEHELMFTYTFDFMLNVRNHKEEGIRRRGWSEDVTSTIVKCQICGCVYVRDALLLTDEYHAHMAKISNTEEYIADHIKRKGKTKTYRSYASVDLQNWTVRNLVALAARRQQRDIRFLDFGAGGGESSSMARMCGVRDVFAYDPNYFETIQKLFDKENFPGIQCIRKKEALKELGPFDAVVFQSAIEHVLDPRGELQTIFNLMTPGGYLYVNKPVMDLNKELAELTRATKIEKKDRISYYHPGHYNYMLPGEFAKLLKDVGFAITAMVHFPPEPLVRGNLGPFLAQKLKYSVRFLQNLLGIPYTRYFYIVQKP